jgi:CRISPR/Cas system-associated exonuclease Cas4 (RecB family)
MHKQYLKYRAREKGTPVIIDGENKGKIAAKRGHLAHLHSELYIRGAVEWRQMPENFKPFREVYKLLLAHVGEAEAKLDIPIAKATKSTSKGHIIGYLDANTNLSSKCKLIVDVKTGKHEGKLIDHYYQAYFYAYLVFIDEPKIDEIKCHWIYVDHGKTNKWKFQRSKFEKYITDWTPKIKSAAYAIGVNQFTSDKWKCTYCEYSKTCIQGISVNNPKTLEL